MSYDACILNIRAVSPAALTLAMLHFSSPRYLSRGLAPLAAGLMLAAAPLTAAFAQPPVMPDGTIPGNLAVQLKGPDMNPETLDKVKALGVKWIRRGFIWEGVEKEAGVYDFSTYDTFVKQCKERGISIIAPIAFNNKLYGHVKDEPGRTGYAKYAAALAERYKDEPVIWEIWNEPNTMTFWGRHGKKGNTDAYAKEYMDLVAATIPAMRKANPKCIILAGSVSNMWTESYKWMGFCFARGMLKEDWNYWSVHPYGLKTPEDYIEAYAITRKLMDDAGGPSNRPWINSERGFPVEKKKEGFAGGDMNRLYEYQAWHLVRQFLIDQMEGVAMTCWYEWSGKESFALVKTDGTETPAYHAFRQFITQLDGYKFDKRLPTREPRDFVLRYTNPAGGTKLIVWTSPPPMQPADKIVDHPITIPLEGSTGTLETATLLGEKGKVEVKSGAIEVMLTGSPVYITVK
ncbi:hypothetical protein DB346_03335 [Verrucomicrobia bacterium LW23]|nr:hypothetical protein DB346_03335 [Verrucomicrobia bacterium LW23]